MLSRRGQATATMGHRCCGHDIHGPPLRLPGPAEQHQWPIVAVAALGLAPKCLVGQKPGDADALDLLRALIGGRVDKDLVAARALATRCCRLPLALRVAGVTACAWPGSAACAAGA